MINIFIGDSMTQSEKNLKEIMESLPPETPEITYIILKSQAKTKRRKSLL